MTITFKEYKNARNAKKLPYYTISAKSAVEAIRYKSKIKTFLHSLGQGSYISNGDTIKQAGYTIKLIIESDDYNCHYEDIIPRKGAMNSQGYEVYPLDRYTEKQSQRYKQGEGLRIVQSVGDYRKSQTYEFYLPENWIRQFYDNKQQSKANAYTNMIAVAKQALESDIKDATADYYTIGIIVTNPQGEEVFTDYLGGCDEKYASSSEAFYENGMIDKALKAIDTDLAEQADITMLARPDMYELTA